MELTTSQFTLIISAIAFCTFFYCAWACSNIRANPPGGGRSWVDKIRLIGGTVFGYQQPAAVPENSFVRFLQILGDRFMPPKSADYSNVRIKFLRAGIRRDNVTAIF